jgi:hypothetical protein
MDVEAEIKKQQHLLKRRLYYDKHAESIRAQQLKNYYKRKAKAQVEDKPERRGRKPKPRDVVITVGADGCVRVN